MYTVKEKDKLILRAFVDQQVLSKVRSELKLTLFVGTHIPASILLHK